MHRVDGGKVVVLDFAELEEAGGNVPSAKAGWEASAGMGVGAAAGNSLLAHLGRVIDQQVDHNVARAGFKKDGHLGRDVTQPAQQLLEMMAGFRLDLRSMEAGRTWRVAGELKAGLQLQGQDTLPAGGRQKKG